MGTPGRLNHHQAQKLNPSSHAAQACIHGLANLHDAANVYAGPGRAKVHLGGGQCHCKQGQARNDSLSSWACQRQEMSVSLLLHAMIQQTSLALETEPATKGYHVAKQRS
jgi:hypothetical protein